MKILIVASYFPPLNSIASLRPYSWAKWWSRLGHDVTVITTLKEKKDNDLIFDNSGFNLIEVPFWMPFGKANNEIKKDIQKSTQKKSLKICILTFLKNTYKKFVSKTGCFYTCRYPDWHDIWIKKVISKIDCSNYELLVTTGGPYSVHRLGLNLKKHGWTGKWICDWRDLWTRNHIYPGLKIFHPWERHLEKSFHENADAITVVSDPVADILRSMTKTPVFTIYNGFDQDDFVFLFNRNRNKNKKVTISYLGTIYREYQNPSPLFQALGELDKSGMITSDDIVVKFAGYQADVIDLVKEYKVEKYYEYLGFISREKSLELQYDSDLVLFLDFDNDKINGVLTGKLFEYLYCSRKILALGCSYKTSADELIEETSAGICLGENIEEIKKIILKEIELNHMEEKKVIEKNNKLIEQYSRKQQAEQMLKILGEL